MSVEPRSYHAEHCFSYVECSIPAGMTLDEYRRSRVGARPSWTERLLASLRQRPEVRASANGAQARRADVAAPLPT